MLNPFFRWFAPKLRVGGCSRNCVLTRGSAPRPRTLHPMGPNVTPPITCPAREQQLVLLHLAVSTGSLSFLGWHGGVQQVVETAPGASNALVIPAGFHGSVWDLGNGRGPLAPELVEGHLEEVGRCCCCCCSGLPTCWAAACTCCCCNCCGCCTGSGPKSTCCTWPTGRLPRTGEPKVGDPPGNSMGDSCCEAPRNGDCGAGHRG